MMIKINPTTYKQEIKTDKRDELFVEIGDSKDLSKFQPQMKVCRWGNNDGTNECNVSIRLIEDKDEEKETATIIEEDGKIKHIKNKRECHFYHIDECKEHPEGANEFEVILKEDPRKNKGENYTLEFSLEDKDVDYFYQPALTAAEISEGANRPENVVGSYAIYAKINKINYISKEQSDLNKILSKLVEAGAVSVDMSFADQIKNIPADRFTSPDIEKLFREAEALQNKIDKDTRIFKEYKVGKIGHIFRPKNIDAVGKESWGILNIDTVEKKLRVTILAEFLDNAVYPIRHAAGLTFGYTTIGASENLTTSDHQRARVGVPASNGTLTKISGALRRQAGGAINWGVGLFDASMNLLAESGSVAVDNYDSPITYWEDENLSYTVVASTTYYVAAIFDYISSSQRTYFAYDTGGTSGDSKYETSLITFPTWRASWNNSTSKYSFYATYTAAGGSAIKSINGLAIASVKSINGLAIASVKSWNGLTNV